jgi:actin-related protein
VGNAFSNTLFGKVEEERPNIAFNFLKMMRELHRIEVANKMINNILFTGGVCLVPNFMGRFREEIEYFLGGEFKDLKKLCQKMMVTQTQNNSQHLNWIGGAIVS